MMGINDQVAYYASPGPMTDLGGLDAAGVPGDPAGVASMLQGLVLHPFWAAAYGVDVPAERAADLQIRPASGIIEGILTLDSRPLVERRAPEHRFSGNCRHFAVLTVALLRRAGVPARARCGFASYFELDKWVDHWIVEHHDGARWVSLDPQVDDHQRHALGLTADPTDLPPGLFLPAGAAWLRCQAGDLDGDRFGILDEWGQWFIKGNITRDLAALNKIEMLPWDGWSDIEGPNTAPEDLPYIDEIARLTMSDDLDEVRRRFTSEDRLRTPERVLRLFPDPIEDYVPELA